MQSRAKAAASKAATTKEKPHSYARQLPPELNTAEARRYLDKAKALELIDKHYRWLKGKQLLACFCRDMSMKLHLGKGERIAWLPFEIFLASKICASATTTFRKRAVIRVILTW